MKRIIRSAIVNSQDIIALIVVITWCISIFLPELLVDEVTMRSFERIMLIIIGFYFGAHRGRHNPPDKPEPKAGTQDIVIQKLVDDFVGDDD